MSLENPNFLKGKYDLHKSEEVESAAKRTEARTDEKVPQNPSERIQNYLNRFTEIIQQKDPAKRERGIRALKETLYKKHVMQPDQVPESYFETQARIAREQGHGDIEITPEMRDQLSEVVIADQKSSLDTWINYLSSSDATYPDWLKYFAIRSVIGMGEYDKEKKQFTKRSKGTTKPFPDLDREALAYVLDAVKKKQDGKQSTYKGDDKETYAKILLNENFSKLYAFAIEKVTPASVEQLTITEGKWVKYDQNSDHMPLVESLQGHGTGWCTAGESTAEVQLQNGDFYVYYSNDPKGSSTIPRVAIRMEGDNIAEVRGIAKEQNLDPYIGDVVDEKLQEFGTQGERYKKKSADMKNLTEIENKSKSNQELTKEDLEFLYEMNFPIEGFGYREDPRITELRGQRDTKADMLVIFECSIDQIAHHVNDINESTRAFVGKLEPGIFQKIQEYNIENGYISFPKEKIQFISARIGSISKNQLLSNIKSQGIIMHDYTQKILESTAFSTLPKARTLKLYSCTVNQLGFDKNPKLSEVQQRVKELGAQFCPPELSCHLQSKLFNQRSEYNFNLVMKPIFNSDGDPFFFSISGTNDGSNWLIAKSANPDRPQSIDENFVFVVEDSTLLEKEEESRDDYLYSIQDSLERRSR